MDPQSLILLLLMLVAFWLLIIRPARSRQQQISKVQQSVQPGVAVMTGSGLFGTVTDIEGDVVRLEIAPGVHVRQARAGIAKVIEPAAAPGEAPPRDDLPGASDGPT